MNIHILHFKQFNSDLSEKINGQQVFSLKEALESVQKTLSERYQRAYWMKAEMNKLNYYTYSGHCYPDLVQKYKGKVVAEVRGIIWNTTYQSINKKFNEILKEPLKDGINIMFLAKINFDPTRGLSLQILDIDPSYSLGVLEQEKHRNIERLKREGLFLKNKTLTMPMLPRRIAIISVETSKGYADFLKIINKNASGYKLDLKLFPARLQGDLAIRDIKAQLQNIKKYATFFDVVTIIRGGGGEVGLATFNDYSLSKEIADLPLPVLTGIGHATNETITEMVAFKNAITPSACAQFLLWHFEQADLALQNTRQKLIVQCQKRLAFEYYQNHNIQQLLLSNIRPLLNKERERQQFNIEWLRKSILKILSSNRLYYGELSKDLQLKTGKRLNLEKEKVTQIKKTIALVNPKNVLKRGYSLTKINGKGISPEDKLPEEGITIETILFQGQIESIVINPQKKNQND